ncbi:MAG: GTPase HflX [Clostridiales bacterium]|mgnify:CR=1 FL=1|jgi:GTP-binding protein HflX|nr:GTPase HflX [Clostridiales bacterium]
MSKLYNIDVQEERFVLVGVSASDSDDTKESLEELRELVDTAGGFTVGMIIQNREKIHPSTYIGKGKIEEVRQMIFESDATGVVCDDELSPAQLKNLEDALQTIVLDRTVLILDIFAKRATTKEGKLQVEMAQLKYRSTRLVGMGNILSRLGGGIGTRGPGEKKLETDRRHIRERLSQLKRELASLEKSRETARSLRSRSNIPVLAIVGYTNAGKSTLINYLTDAGVLEEDKLFATLDPTTRSYTMESGQQVLFTDTVGFIRKLPHHLVEAFRSTLEEAKYADIIIHVVDSVNPDAYKQMHIVYETLANLGVKDKSIITVFNKQDLVETEQVIKDFKADHTVKLSAKTGEGVDKLLDTIERVLTEQKILIEELFPYSEAGKIQTIRKYGQLLVEEFRQEGIYVKAYISKELLRGL